MPLLAPTAFVRNAVRRFRRDGRGSAAVEFAFIAPVFFVLLFAIIETAIVFFASQVLEGAVQDTGRLIYDQCRTSPRRNSRRISAAASPRCFRVTVTSALT